MIGAVRLPTDNAVDDVDQLSPPDPLVTRNEPAEPPVIFTFPTAPRDTFDAPTKLTLPVDARLTSVPSEVMLNCAAVVTLPVRSPINSGAVIVPDEVRPTKVPRDVIFG
jgi:hypothetical protein